MYNYYAHLQMEKCKCTHKVMLLILAAINTAHYVVKAKRSTEKPPEYVLNV